MKSLERLRDENCEEKIELDAAQDYFERTGRRFENQTPVDQRKIMENWKEDHQ